MPLSVFIVHAGPAQLRLLCALGCACGLVAFLFGLRRGRRPQSVTTAASDETPDPKSLFSSQNSDHVSQAVDSMPQVIRLSLPPMAVRTADMTQQQRVAAALARAGIANPVRWTASSLSEDRAQPKHESTPVALADLSQPPAAHAIKPMTPPEAPVERSLGRKLLLIGGPLIVLLSLYFFLRIH